MRKRSWLIPVFLFPIIAGPCVPIEMLSMAADKVEKVVKKQFTQQHKGGQSCN